VTAAFLAIVIAGFFLWPKIESFFWGEDGEIRLEVAEPTVFNPPAEFSTINAVTIQKPETEPTVAATVRNYGEDTAWIEEARIKVVAGVRLDVCFTQGGGDVPRSRRYRTMLPEFPSAEPRLIRRDLHVEVQPGHGVRPVLAFPKGDFDATNLYALEVKFVADPGDRVLDAGRFVVATPEPVNRSGTTLPESEGMLDLARSAGRDPVVEACYQHNLLGTQRVVAEPGKRDADIAALTHLRPAPNWHGSREGRPVRQLVAELLGSEASDAPIYAVETAELGDDPEFAADVRDRAVSLLLRRGREELNEDPKEAMRNAERALSLNPSSEATRLLWRATASWRAEEERARAELAKLMAE
jgi:hypothetical protein